MPVEVKELLIKQNNNNSKTSFDTEVYDQITRFLRDIYRKSENTGQAYERDIRNFLGKPEKKTSNI